MREKTRVAVDFPGGAPFEEIREIICETLKAVVEKGTQKHPDLQSENNPIAKARVLYLSNDIDELSAVNSVSALKNGLRSLQKDCNQYLEDISKERKTRKTRGSELFVSLGQIAEDLQLELDRFKLMKAVKARVYEGFFRPGREGGEVTLKDWERIGAKETGYNYYINGEPLTISFDSVEELDGFMLEKGLSNEVMRQYILMKAHQDGLFSPLQLFTPRILNEATHLGLSLGPTPAQTYHSLIDLKTITLQQLHQLVRGEKFGELNEISDMLGLTPKFFEQYLFEETQLSFETFQQMSAEEIQEFLGDEVYGLPIFQKLCSEEESHVHIQMALSVDYMNVFDDSFLPTVTMKVGIDITEQEGCLEIINVDFKVSDETLSAYDDKKQYIRGAEGAKISLKKFGDILRIVGDVPSEDVEEIKRDIEANVNTFSTSGFKK